MKIYKRGDGFEVQDALNRDIDWVRSAFGGSDWVEQPLPVDDPKVKERNAIKNELEALDFASIRALRTDDKQRLSDLEAQAVVLREKLSDIN